ncbi:SARP family transcriptional regulator [Amycolatopsis mediterranei S699]|uniref:SARP family transcriptional regulator n=2 Tax=Amycolatopsis mediterranei TaxID=33910 RepID=A0A0H3D6F3_AMYMU|nr:SARP family transcriptional regulator [Amycolatopsis mediterranei U32]AEK42982.1 SARP family transcriptional regulator [Amycolatopsis mediterranei S699]AGT85030.1 SARP family transcriptional regulator [Amycolatopsis mediterranei RB]KDO05727.1 SARP family transcriptional regulator [Amycolatopsis mediterranei]AFO77902.1 SARP family transcriptional regulator [Amycolatopsis mediterranei S699]
MRFHLLGPLTVTVGGRAVPLGGAKQRVLLAHLLLNANRTVSPGQLIDTLWRGDPPTSATANLQTYVWRLRRLLPDGVALRTHDPGYSLVVDPGDVDAHRFARLVGDAARAAEDGSPETALTLLAEAEALWRGDPLEDLPTAAAWDAELGRLVENRLAAVEERLALQVRLGRHDPAIAELTVLLAEHPYRERLWQQYLLALAGAGRRAEALQAYATARERLVTELGVEPGPELRTLQAAILTGDPLPGPAPVVLTGAPGTGKTALAMHVAHGLADRFPDGQLYVDLAGTGAPRDPAEVLADFLHALGVTGNTVPPGLGQRAALFRSRLAGRRTLLVLDDAAAAAQVRPLLPADAGCAVLVTTRGRLPELAGAKHVELPVFGEREAARLLAELAGPDRVDGEPAEAAEIVRCCGYLPLAIRIAGARLAGRQAWSLRTLHDRLADESSRLSELRVGDLGVRPSFELSLRQLPPSARTAFGRSAVLGAQDFPSWVVDALLDRMGTHDVLDVLVDANLVSLTGRDSSGHPRYRLHDLLRCYATELLAEEPLPARRETLARVLSVLLALAKTAAAALPPAFGAMTGPAVAAGPVPDRLVADPLGWFTAERKLLAAAVQLAAEAGLDELAWQLTAAAVPFYDLRGAYDDWRRSHLTALSAAEAAGNRAGAAVLARGLGQVRLYHDEYEEASQDMRRSAELFAELGDIRGEALAVAGLGTVARVRERPREALGFYRRALAGLERADDRSGVAQMRNSIGSTYALLGSFAEAETWLRRARELAREIEDPHREAKVLTELGTLHRETGRLSESLTCLRLALSILEELDDERCSAYALLGIGQTLLEAGEPVQARGVCDRALRVFRETGNHQGETTGLALLEQAQRRRTPSAATRT